jgi:SSS family solute:Na+ symporter
VLGVLLAIVIPTVIDSLTVFYAVLGVSLFVPLAAGLHTRRPGVPEALAAIAVGIVALLYLRLADLGSISRLLDPTLVAILASGVAFTAVHLFRKMTGRLDVK